MDVVNDVGLQDAKASHFPLSKGLHLLPNHGELLCNPD